MAQQLLEEGTFDIDIDGLNGVGKFVRVSGGGFVTRPQNAVDGNGTSPSRPGEFTIEPLRIEREFDGNEALVNWAKATKQGKPEVKDLSVIWKESDGTEVARVNYSGVWPSAYHPPAGLKNPGSDEGNARAVETLVLEVEDIDYSKA